jgi:hypothetical protein
MSTQIEFVPLIRFGALELGIAPMVPERDPRRILDGRAGVYVWGFVFPERPDVFLPYYIGKHEHSILCRLSEHLHCGIPYGTHTLMSPEYLRSETRLSLGFRDIWDGDEESRSFVFPRAIRKEGRARHVDDSCAECGRAHCKTCPGRSAVARFYQEHFHACAYLLPMKAGVRGAQTIEHARHARDLERHVMDRYPLTLGRRSSHRGTTEFDFRANSGFPYPDGVPSIFRVDPTRAN